MQQVGPTPMYLQIVQWAGVIVQIIQPIAVAVILALALVKFWQLVNRIAPKDVKIKGAEPKQTKAGK